MFWVGVAGWDWAWHPALSIYCLFLAVLCRYVSPGRNLP